MTWKYLKFHLRLYASASAMTPGRCVPGFTLVILMFCLLWSGVLCAGQELPCPDSIRSTDALVVADPDGRIIYKKNETKKCIPASTLKILTALTAIHHLGAHYRFPTQFYMDPDQNLKVKGYGDPLLVSEVWQEIADALSKEIGEFRNLVLDDTYFAHHIVIPGRRHSTNPYDAPVGALCANFNTLFFERDQQGRIISSEPQTPLIPFARKRIQRLGLKRGRYTFSHDQKEITRYAGELLLHFLQKKGVNGQGKIYMGDVKAGDRLIYDYRSRYTLEQALSKMLEFSNNFMANQICIALGAQIYGPPGTLEKGVKVMSSFAKSELHLESLEIVEGSGISRKNRLSAMEMLTILKRFKPYRHTLVREEKLLYKTGSLRGIRTRAGYLEGPGGGYYYIVVFLNRARPDMNTVMRCLTQTLTQDPP